MKEVTEHDYENFTVNFDCGLVSVYLVDHPVLGTGFRTISHFSNDETDNDNHLLEVHATEGSAGVHEEVSRLMRELFVRASQEIPGSIYQGIFDTDFSVKEKGSMITSTRYFMGDSCDCRAFLMGLFDGRYNNSFFNIG